MQLSLTTAAAAAVARRQMTGEGRAFQAAGVEAGSMEEECGSSVELEEAVQAVDLQEHTHRSRSVNM